MWAPTSAFLMCVAAGGIYATADIGHTKGKNAAKIMIASVAVGFIAVAIDNATNGPAGTGLAALFLFSAFMSKGANAVVLASNLINNIGSKK